jgi:probable DNA repair protein
MVPLHEELHALPENLPDSFIDRWIGDGGILVAASERAARAAHASYHRRRRAEGSSTWAAPAILAWSSFVASAWDTHARDERMVLNPAQEQDLWAGIIGREQHLAAALEAPRRRLAALAMEAHALLCSYAPRFLREATRAGWDRDAGAFSGWLSAFDQLCRDRAFISQQRVPLDLAPLLQSDATSRPPLLLIGFDRLLPLHKSLFDAWGSWQEAAPGTKANEIHFYSASDEESELAACSNWCAHILNAKPDAGLLVLAQDIAERRGAIERAFLRSTASTGAHPAFEFSLGVPLLQMPLARASFLFLSWLDGPLSESQVDWLFASGYLAAAPQHVFAIQGHMRALRRRNLARPQWTLDAFLRSGAPVTAALRRVAQAQQALAVALPRIHTPLEWAALVPDLLRTAGLASDLALSSAEFQTSRRWEHALDLCGSLGFDGRRISWPVFLASFESVLDSTLFAPESTDASIQIAGPGESAGLTADAIWFLGVDEDSWPASGTAHPLLPLALQREYAMPHASPRHDAELAASVLRRVLESAQTVNFSYAAQNENGETRASRVIVQAAGASRPLPASWISAPQHTRSAVAFDDSSRVPFPHGKAPGGSATLTAQSQCPFKAFATARLGAKSWEPAEFGLSASQRGLLLHAVMHAVWAGPPDGLRSLEDLRTVADPQSFVTLHIENVLRDKLPAETRDRMPQRYLDLEATRLARLVGEWLKYEAARLPFSVAQTESACTIDIAGLSLDLRIDRVDTLNDGSPLVIDYKTGNVSPKAWELPRPEDVQLPLYAGFACSQPGGLLFAKLRAGEAEFVGRLANASATLRPVLHRNTDLVRKPLTQEQLEEWKRAIEQLAHDFLAGRADVDPRDYPDTCDECGLHAICRIHENRTEPEEEDEIEEFWE